MSVPAQGSVVAIGINPLSGLKGAVQDAAGSFLDSIGKAFCNMAADMSSSVFSFASQKTSIDLSKSYFLENYDIVFGVAALVVIAIFLCSAIMAAVRGDPHMLVRALASTGTAIIGSFVALALLEMVLAASDGMATAFGAGKPLGQDLVAQLRALPDHGNFALDMVLSLLVALFSFALFAVLYIRKIAILIVALFIPLFLAGQPAASTRGWMKRAAELLLALIFTKPVIYAIFTLGAGLASDNTGSATDQTLGILSGIVVMVASVFSPLLLLYLLGIADVQLAAAVSGGGRRAMSSFGQGAGALLGSTSRDTFKGIGSRLQSRGGATSLGGGAGVLGGSTAGGGTGRPKISAGRPKALPAAAKTATGATAGVRRGGAELARGAAGRSTVQGARAAANRTGTPAPSTRSSGGRAAGAGSGRQPTAPVPSVRRASGVGQSGTGRSAAGRSVASPAPARRAAPPPPAPATPRATPALPPSRAPGGARSS